MVSRVNKKGGEFLMDDQNQNPTDNQNPPAQADDQSQMGGGMPTPEPSSTPEPTMPSEPTDATTAPAMGGESAPVPTESGSAEKCTTCGKDAENGNCKACGQNQYGCSCEKDGGEEPVGGSEPAPSATPA